jgi:hypothetical protein
VVFDEAKARAYVFEPITVTVDRGPVTKETQ